VDKITLKSKTGFEILNLNTPVIIDDYRGIEFYNTQPLLDQGNKVRKFNLPAGTYQVREGNFVAMKYPVKMPLAKLPRTERYRKPPFDFVIKFGDNPNKCTIFWVGKTIVFDNSFKTMPLPYVFFVLYHEYGHSLFGTEKYADLVASNIMKIRGYNISQIYRAQIFSLSELQWERKKFLSEQLRKAQK
jgi:hypothetical protein